MDIPPRNQLYCGRSETGKCNECTSREGRALTCYRQSTGHRTTGVCIAKEHCPRGEECVDKCKRQIGCFGDDICNERKGPPNPNACEAFCASPP
jgi:hypothetical protein